MEQVLMRVNNFENILVENNSSLTCSAIVMNAFQNRLTDTETRLNMMEKRLEIMQNNYNTMVVRSAKVMESMNQRILDLEQKQTSSKYKNKRDYKGKVKVKLTR